MKTKAKDKRANRTRGILVRLRVDEWTRLKGEARARGLGLSTWLRTIALEKLQKADT